ncbi:MAG: tRNA lysidine(34) synthetase TilS [Sedimentisphaerales bacterium]|nr:tRNA lysidine(34) synthetase TilS [Sedimentisphaerales bacterium]
MIELLSDILKPVSVKSSCLVAVSGGADSVALLHLLLARQQRLADPCQLVCGHVNHQLRGADADADQHFVEDLAARYGLPILTRRVDVKGYAKTNRLSIETAGRHLRLAALEEMARQADCQTIATGHHKDDLAETMLMRLLRGTAFSGLVGIRPVAQRNGLQWIRPLLAARRRDITAYCVTHGLAWREDQSNADVGFRRNWVRHRLLPCLQEQACGDVVSKLEQLHQSAAVMQSRLEQKVDILWREAVTASTDGVLSLRASAIADSGPFVGGELLGRIYDRLGCGRRDLTETHYQQVFALAGQTELQQIDMPGGCRLRRESESLLFTHRDRQETSLPAEGVEIPQEGQVPFDPWLIESRCFDLVPGQLEAFMAQNDPSIQWFDMDQVAWPLIARPRTDGDRFMPMGQSSPKRVSRFLTHSQTDTALRRQTFIIADQRGILWLAPVRRAGQCRVTADTRKVVAIRVSKRNQ